jgi:DNA-directed RNA polymerase specialized sigma24 family protein
MENTRQFDTRQAEFHRFVNDSYQKLLELKAEDKREEFNKLLIQVLADTRRYFTRGLRVALSKGVISRNKYEPEDLFDQLIIDVYDNLEEAGSKDAFHTWLFKRAVKLLDDLEVEEEFDSYFYDNIDDYSRAELAKMQEPWSTDGDGDFMLLDNLDDISYKDQHYILKNIYLDDAHQDMMALMDADQGSGKTEKHLNAVLYRLPPGMRSVFELATEQGFSIEEIAMIKELPVDQIDTILDTARELLRESLKDRLHES